MQRRDFLNSTSAMASGILGANVWSGFQSKTLVSPLPDGLKILFQGDSITDAGRDRGDYYANSGRGMGGGYVYQVVAELLGQNPEANLKCYNRGISGHKVFQLADRWDLDCVALQPDVLSILIGVNDYWHMLNGNYDGTVEIYEHDYRQLLAGTRQALPRVKLIICEPFAVEGGTAINEKWADFNSYREVAKKLADEFNTAFVPFHSIFQEALKHAPASYWCPDGVHPSVAGAFLMKQAWLKALERTMM